MRKLSGDNQGKLGKRGKTALARLLPPGLVALLLLSTLGCPGNNRLEKNEDPLLGGYKPKSTTQSQSKSPVPPIPQVNTTMSNAAMAAAVPLDGDIRKLGIPDENAKPVSGGWNLPGNSVPTGTWAAPPGTTNSQKPLLGPPQPITTPVPTYTQPQSGQVQPSIAPSGYAFATPNTVPVQALSLEQVQIELKKRDVLWQKAENTPEGVRFFCAVPHPQNPSAERIIDVTAPTLPQAVLAAIQRIDQP